MVQEWELFTYCAEKLFIVRLSLKKKKNFWKKKLKRRPESFSRCHLFFKIPFFAFCTHRRKFPIRSFPVSKVFFFFPFLFSLFIFPHLIGRE
jgi:hypothetical protein